MVGWGRLDDQASVGCGWLFVVGWGRMAEQCSVGRKRLW